MIMWLESIVHRFADWLNDEKPISESFIHEGCVVRTPRGEKLSMPPCKPPRSETVNRVEIIGPNGREFVKYFVDDLYFSVQYQDGGKTVKIFLSSQKNS